MKHIENVLVLVQNYFLGSTFGHITESRISWWLEKWAIWGRSLYVKISIKSLHLLGIHPPLKDQSQCWIYGSAIQKKSWLSMSERKLYSPRSLPMRMVCRPPILHCQSAHSSCKEKVWGSSVVGSVCRGLDWLEVLMVIKCLISG